MNVGRLFAAMVAVALLTGCATPQPQKQADLTHLRIATEGAYPPFNYVASDGSLQGFEVDLAKALCAKMQADCTIVQQQWDGMIPELMRGKYDAIIASMAITEKRKQLIDFSDPYYNTPAILVAKRGTKIILGSDGNPTSESFKGLRIGVQKKTIHSLYASENFAGAQLSTYLTADEADAALIAGRIDARFDDILALDSTILKDHGDTFAVFGRGYFGGLLGNGVGVGVRKEDTALRGAFNAALKAIHADGTYQKIDAKYFKFDLYPQSAP